MVIKNLRAWLLALAVCSGVALNVVGTPADCVPETDFVTMNLRLANSDTQFETSVVHEFDIHNGHKMTVTGFDSTSAIGLGFRCRAGCSLGEGKKNQAKATVSQLEPGETYRFRLWEFSLPEEVRGGRWENELTVNGVQYDTVMGSLMAAYGYTEADENGEIEIIFFDTGGDGRLGFTQINVAKICDCGDDTDCPGGELCEGSDAELEANEGVCTEDVKEAQCADQDYRGPNTTCRSWGGNGFFAGEAYCTAFPSSDRPDFNPLEMCCGCDGGLSWVTTDYQHDNGGYTWQDFGSFKKDESAGEVVLEVGKGHKTRGVMVDGAPGKNTPRRITVWEGKSSTGPWKKLTAFKLDKLERSWIDFQTSKAFLRLSWDETYSNEGGSRLSRVNVKFGDRVPDIEEPAGGWTGKFSLVSGNVDSDPKCVVVDGCVTSPNWPGSYPNSEACEISVDEDTVLVATHFEVVTGERITVNDDYLVLDSSIRRSSGLFTNSAGPFHVPVAAGDSLIWSPDDWESGSGFRICGYTPEDGDDLAVWPPIEEECPLYETKKDCKKGGCKWNKKKNTCGAKPRCSSASNKKKCNTKELENEGCEWNRREKACQAGLYDYFY